MAGYEEIIQEYEKLKGDEKLKFPLLKSLEALAGAGKALTEIGKVKAAVSQLAVGEEVIAVKMEQIPYSYTLAAGQKVMMTEYAPFSGYIKVVVIHWPDGCDALVDVRVGHGVEQFCPREGYLALNDATPKYEGFNEWVEMGEEIWVEMRNGDGAQPHSITVTVDIRGTT